LDMSVRSMYFYERLCLTVAFTSTLLELFFYLSRKVLCVIGKMM
jgi:hypothetical protein